MKTEAEVARIASGRLRGIGEPLPLTRIRRLQLLSKPCRMSPSWQFPTLDGREEGVAEPFCLGNWMDVASPIVNATYTAAGLAGRRFCRPLAAWAQAGA